MIPALIGAGAILGSTILGSALSSSQASSNRAASFEMQKDDQEFQREMWEKSNKYNSPVNQARLMQSGGFSPSSLYDHGGSTVSQASTPSVGSHSYTPFMSSLEQNPLMGLSTVAQTIESIMRAKKAGAETNTIESMLDKTLHGMELSNREKELQNGIIEAYGKQKAHQEVAESVARVAELASRSNFENEQAKSEQIKQVGYAIDNLIKEVEKDLKGTELQKAKTFLETYKERCISEIQNIKASTQESRSAATRNYSQANFMDQLSLTEKELRQGKITAQDLSNDLLDISKMMRSRENVRDAYTHQDKINAIVAECERQNLINEEMTQKIKHAITENNWQEVQYFMGCLGQAVGMVTSIGNFGVSQMNALTQQERLQISRDFNRIYEQGQNSSVTNYAPGENGSWRPVWHSERSSR